LLGLAQLLESVRLVIGLFHVHEGRVVGVVPLVGAGLLQEALNWLGEVFGDGLVRLVADFKHFLVDDRVDFGIVFLVVKYIGPQLVLDVTKGLDLVREGETPRVVLSLLQGLGRWRQFKQILLNKVGRFAEYSAVRLIRQDLFERLELPQILHN
jgi:hypothetical protein